LKLFPHELDIKKFLNPQMNYRPGFKGDLEVKRGLMDCLTRMVEDEDEQTLIDVQMDHFNKMGKMFWFSLGY